MSPDVFEDELRTLLHGATDAQSPAFTDVDTDAVLHTGHRIVRRRRMAMVGGTAAAALVVAAGTWAALGESVDRASERIPAVRTTMADVGVVTTRLDRPTLNGSPAGSAWTVRLDTGTGAVTATAVAEDGTAGDPVEIGTLPRTGGRAVWATVSTDPFTVVAVVPADAEQLMTRYTGEIGGSSESTGPLAGSPYQAVVFGSEKSPDDAALAGLDWATDDAVFDASGREVPSVALDDRRVYVDEAGDELGVIEPDGTVRTALSSYTALGVPPRISAGRQDPGQQMETTFVMVLPAGSRDVSAELASGVQPSPTRTATLPGGRGTVVLVRAVGPEDTSPVVTGLMWSRDGRWSTWRDGQPLTVPTGKGEDALRLSVDVLSGQTGTQVVVGSMAGGTILPADTLSVDDLGSDGIARRGDGGGSDRVLAVLPSRPKDVTATGRPASAFAEGSFGWSTVRVPGTDAWLVATIVHGNDEVTSWTGLRWTDASGAEHDLAVS